MFKNPVTANIITGLFLTTIGSSMFTYTPVFFVRTWPAYKSTFALLNAIALTVLGFSSALLGGMICDKYEERNPMIKAQVLMAGNLATIPLTAIACWT